VVGSCWQNRFAYGGAATLTAQRADAMDTTSSTQSFFDVRSLSLYTDVLVNQYMELHVMLNQHATLTNNMPVSDVELGDDIELDEAYLTAHHFMNAPVYVKLGQSYSIFGNYYDPYPPVFSINKGFVQAKNTNVTVGIMADAGYDLSAFVFENETSQDWNEYGLRLGYEGDLMGLDFFFNAAYVDNYSALTGTMSAHPSTNANLDQAAYDVAAGFKARDLKIWLEYFATAGNVLSTGNTTNAEPKVFSAKAYYDFKMADKKAYLRATYEKAADASAMSSHAFSAAQSAEKHLSAGVVMAIDSHAYLSMDYHRFTPFDNTLNDQKQLVGALTVYF